MILTDDVIVEFFGMPRFRAGRGELRVAAGSVADVLASVSAACPRLSGLVGADGRLAPHYLLSLDGRRFVTDLQENLRAGDRLLLLTADAGG
jgi:hypothetical protein